MQPRHEVRARIARQIETHTLQKWLDLLEEENKLVCRAVSRSCVCPRILFRAQLKLVLDASTNAETEAKDLEPHKIAMHRLFDKLVAEKRDTSAGIVETGLFCCVTVPGDDGGTCRQCSARSRLDRRRVCAR